MNNLSNVSSSLKFPRLVFLGFLSVKRLWWLFWKLKAEKETGAGWVTSRLIICRSPDIWLIAWHSISNWVVGGASKSIKLYVNHMAEKSINSKCFLICWDHLNDIRFVVERHQTFFAVSLSRYQLNEIICCGCSSSTEEKA